MNQKKLEAAGLSRKIAFSECYGVKLDDFKKPGYKPPRAMVYCDLVSDTILAVNNFDRDTGAETPASVAEAETVAKEMFDSVAGMLKTDKLLSPDDPKAGTTTHRIFYYLMERRSVGAWPDVVRNLADDWTPNKES